ncbi:hypothetical protein JYT26_02605 [Beggiatoa alba]|nr:hypothetical protein [Beggiatoa alba]
MLIDWYDVITALCGHKKRAHPNLALFKEKYAAILSGASAGENVTLYHLSGAACGFWDFLCRVCGTLAELSV